MAALKRTTRPDRFVTRFREFARDVLSPVADDEGRVDGSHNKLLEVAALLIQYARQHTFQLWPGDSSQLLTLLGELAAITIAEHRCGTPVSGLRAVLQAFKQELDGPISSRAANQSEQERQAINFCAVAFAADELDNLAAVSHPPTSFGEKR